MSRDLARMLDRLRDYLGVGAALTSITALSTGHSNETYKLEGINRILRMPPSKEGLLPPYDMAAQHAVLDAMSKQADGPPVPKVYELCTDAALLGDAFFIMECLDGEAFEYVTPEWLKALPATTRDGMCAQWIGAVAKVHRLPVSAMPAPARTVVEEAQHWLEVARGAEASPDLVAVLDDLVRNPPRPSGPPCPIHGDPKHGNTLWNRQGRMLALLDWEMAGVSDPLLDLGYVLQFYDQGEAALGSAGYELPGWWSRSRTIDEWQKLTGRTAIDMHRYEAIQVAKVAAIIQLGVHLYDSGRAPDPRFASWAAIVPPYVALAVRLASQ